MVAALRQHLRLTEQQWGKLGHVQPLVLPASVPGSAGAVRCSQGEAVKVLQAQHAWVGMEGSNPCAMEGQQVSHTTPPQGTTWHMQCACTCKYQLMQV
jgi:hypothetical protein